MIFTGADLVSVCCELVMQRRAAGASNWLGLLDVHFLGLSEIVWKNALLTESSHEDGFDEM